MKRKRKENRVYLISLSDNTGYIFGGSFRLGGEKYAKITKLHKEAKRYSSITRAIEAGKKLARSCKNLKGSFVVEDEDGYQKRIYTV